MAGEWKTVLTAGMGQGAQGLFALDVTQPQQFMTGKRVLFEFTEQDDPDIGFVTAAPAIVKINTGKNNYQYFVAVTNGHNSANTNNDAFLFLLSLDKRLTTPWVKDSNYYKIRIPYQAASPNPLSAPGLVLNAEQALSYAYAGDWHGNLWRFDFTKSRPASVAPEILFTAQDSQGLPQPITAPPVVAFGPHEGYLVLFGTGRLSDNHNSSQRNSFYAIYDDAKSNKKNRYVTSRAQLAQRQVEQIKLAEKSSAKVTGQPFTYGTAASDKKGWYLDLPGSDAHFPCVERSVSKGVIAYGTVFFNTVIPQSASCNEAGSSISYALDTVTGIADSTNQKLGLNSQSNEPVIQGPPLPITTKIIPRNRDAFGQRQAIANYVVLNFANEIPWNEPMKKPSRRDD
jgi:type IV pilus assembly protein PilY1